MTISLIYCQTYSCIEENENLLKMIQNNVDTCIFSITPMRICACVSTLEG